MHPSARPMFHLITLAAAIFVGGCSIQLFSTTTRSSKTTPHPETTLISHAHDDMELLAIGSNFLPKFSVSKPGTVIVINDDSGQEVYATTVTMSQLIESDGGVILDLTTVDFEKDPAVKMLNEPDPRYRALLQVDEYQLDLYTKYLKYISPELDE